jgi:hypothetical protein
MTQRPIQTFSGVDDIRCDDEVVAAGVKALRNWVPLDIQDFEFQPGILREPLFCGSEESG